ncbi:hypothetical protein FACS1894132_07510 [Clostridia bacterium]|nr:hypothetical protein FACS1894132_07510 [Clostridia bacterium]
MTHGYATATQLLSIIKVKLTIQYLLTINTNHLLKFVILNDFAKIKMRKVPT